MTNSRLNRRALVLLIQDNCASLKRGYKRVSVSAGTIETVLDSIDSLKRAYIRDIPKK